jgi:4-aminobutyrate aminotransferase
VIEEGLLSNATDVGAYLIDKLNYLKNKHAVIGDVRGLGLMIGVEFVRADGSGTPDSALRDKVMKNCFERGLLLLGCGESTLRFCPPLIVNQEESTTAAEIFDSVISELA